MAAATQTESQIISSFLIRDDRGTRKTKRREGEKRREKKLMRIRTTRKKKKRKKREKNNPLLRCCASEYETTKANLVQGQQTLCATSH